jgi:hypothetical protein
MPREIERFHRFAIGSPRYPSCSTDRAQAPELLHENLAKRLNLGVRSPLGQRSRRREALCPQHPSQRRWVRTGMFLPGIPQNFFERETRREHRSKVDEVATLDAIEQSADLVGRDLSRGVDADRTERHPLVEALGRTIDDEIHERLLGPADDRVATKTRSLAKDRRMGWTGTPMARAVKPACCAPTASPRVTPVLATPAVRLPLRCRGWRSV